MLSHPFCHHPRIGGHSSPPTGAARAKRGKSRIRPYRPHVLPNCPIEGGRATEEVLQLVGANNIGMCAAQPLHQLPRLVRGDALDQFVIDLKGRGTPTSADALGMLHRDDPLRVGLAMRHTCFVFERMEDVIGTEQHAGDRGAAGDEVAADRFPLVHGVEGGRRQHLGWGDPYQLCNFGHPFLGQIAVFGHGQVKKRHHR